MKSLYLLLICCWVYLTNEQFNPTCRSARYMCDFYDKIQQEDECMFFNDTKNKLRLIKPCTNPEKPICNWTAASFGKPGYCIAAPEAELTLPGEACSKNSDCWSGVCDSGTCIGHKDNETCTVDEDCHVGTYCSTWEGKCRTQKEFGQNCTRDLDCTNNCACNLGYCVYYYILDNYLTADNPKACASGYIFNGTCYPGLVSTIKGRPCTSDSECIVYDSHLDKYYQHGTCKCGYNGAGYTYCTLSEGDVEFYNMKQKLQFIVATSFYCHTKLRFGPCRQLYDDEYKDFQIAMRYFDNYTMLVFNDECIQRVITWEYWKFILGGENLSIQLPLMILLLLFVLNAF